MILTTVIVINGEAEIKTGKQQLSLIRSHTG